MSKYVKRGEVSVQKTVPKGKTKEEVHNQIKTAFLFYLAAPQMNGKSEKMIHRDTLPLILGKQQY